MLLFDRTHRLSEDLDWVPEGLRRGRWTRGHVYRDKVEALEWIIDPGDASYDEPSVRDRLGALQLIHTSLADLASVTGGQLVRVEGRVVASHTIDGVVVKRRGVVRRLAFEVDDVWWIHEAAVPFAIEDGKGRRVEVQVSNARLLARLGPPDERSRMDFVHEDAPAGVRVVLGTTFRQTIVPSAERVLQDGEQVTIFGVRAATLHDADGYRDAPETVSLEGRPELPLLIVTNT